MSEERDPFQGKSYAGRKATSKGKRPPEQRVAAYRIGEQLKTRIDKTAASHNVEKGDLVKYLLTVALDQLEAGQLNLPTVAPKGPRKIDL